MCTHRRQVWFNYNSQWWVRRPQQWHSQCWMKNLVQGLWMMHSNTAHVRSLEWAGKSLPLIYFWPWERSRFYFWKRTQASSLEKWLLIWALNESLWWRIRLKYFKSNLKPALQFYMMLQYLWCSVVALLLQGKLWTWFYLYLKTDL